MNEKATETLTQAYARIVRAQIEHIATAQEASDGNAVRARTETLAKMLEHQGQLHGIVMALEGKH